MTLSQVATRTWQKTQRTKTLSKNMLDTPLNRCLHVLDLVLLSVGNMAGAGLYIITGVVVRRKAGPSTILSYLLAGLSALLNGLCYAELSTRMPKAGSSYTYTYVAGGELIAFIVGWSVILEYVLSAASAARGFSGTFNILLNPSIINSNETVNYVDFVSIKPDYLAASLILVIVVIIGFGAKISVNFNSIITALNLFILLFATIMMLFNADISNWTNAKIGGFVPFGLKGIIGGAGTCFFSFLGFDIVSLSSEETVNPTTALSHSIISSILFLIFVLMVVSSALTLYVPWQHIDVLAAIPSAFAYHGVTWAVYLFGIGSLIGILSTICCSVYGLPRVVYAMAHDGLIFRWLGKVFHQTRVPLFGLVVFSLPTLLLAFLIELEILADFLSVGTLIAYSIVSYSVVSLRYANHQIPTVYDLSPNDVDISLYNDECKPLSAGNPRHKGFGAEGRLFDRETDALHSSSANSLVDSVATDSSHSPSAGNSYCASVKPSYRNIFPFSSLLNVTPFVVPRVLLGTLVFLSFLLALLVSHGLEFLLPAFVLICAIFLLLLMIVALLLLQGYEANNNFSTFKVPWVPFLPIVCIFINMVLIVNLSKWTWVRFFAWLFIGLIIYFSYGIWNSSEEDDVEDGNGETKNPAAFLENLSINAEHDKTALVNALQDTAVQDKFS